MNKANPVYRASYLEPGRYTVQLPISAPDSGLLVVGMTTEHGLYFEDTVWVSICTCIYHTCIYIDIHVHTIHVYTIH